MHEDRYTIRISKGTALLPETQAILEEWRPGEQPAELADRVLQKDLLGKSSAQRVTDIVQRVIRPRYFDPSGCPAHYLQTLLEHRKTGEWFRNLCLLYSARADVLLRDSVAVLLRESRDVGRLSIGLTTVMEFLHQAQNDGRMASRWSPEVTRKIARGLLKALAEFGFVSPTGKRERSIQYFSPHPIATAYLAFELHFQGQTDASLASHPDWNIWLLDERAVRMHLDELSQYGLWVFQAAGSVVRITWNVSSMEEAINVLARLNI